VGLTLRASLGAPAPRLDLDDRGRRHIGNAQRLGKTSSGRRLAKIADRHPRSAKGTRLGGLLGTSELVRDQTTREPLVPDNAAGPDARHERVLRRPAEERALADDPLQRNLRVPSVYLDGGGGPRGLAILDEALYIADAHTTRRPSSGAAS